MCSFDTYVPVKQQFAQVSVCDTYAKMQFIFLIINKCECE